MVTSRMVRAVLAAAILVSASAAMSQEGVTRTSILLGQSGEYSGQGVARENIDGAKVYFAAVNRRGGIHGRTIELKTYDDGRDVKRVVANTERLITQDKVFALFGYRSTPSVEAAIPVITREKVPMVAPFSGAQSIRSPHHPMVFHLRASYHQEAVRLIQQLTTQGVSRIAVMYQDDSFGKDALVGFEEALNQAKVKSLATAKYDRKDMDVRSSVLTISAVKPDAVAMACSPKACIDFIKQMRARGLRSQFLTLSNVNSDEFAKSLGPDGRGVVVTQVIPYPWSPTVPLAREFRQALKDTGMQVPVSYSSFEGFIAAKLVAGALRLAGPDLNRAKFITALESMSDLDLGGLRVGFSPTDHEGSNYVDLSLISREGKYIR
ncbi:ABC transporter substrate-binding protein [Piscinibacter sp. HJYY11]|uniref:ABC transporter substrate-binding protein n=1 Tax=Piscinibacter sp. HJYY11 TaxID=2801333 RepID=UPI00191ECF09|nr:ABC transporter substrate-binding protein [Piscinibacter sp. HJYY11]MBL0729435.1 ABC transporter substrate-binding protein [Piscinibacter sp. HJYY11]